MEDFAVLALMLMPLQGWLLALKIVVPLLVLFCVLFKYISLGVALTVHPHITTTVFVGFMQDWEDRHSGEGNTYMLVFNDQGVTTGPFVVSTTWFKHQHGIRRLHLKWYEL